MYSSTRPSWGTLKQKQQFKPVRTDKKHIRLGGFPLALGGPVGFRKVREADRMNVLQISSNSDLMARFVTKEITATPYYLSQKHVKIDQCMDLFFFQRTPGKSEEQPQKTQERNKNASGTLRKNCLKAFQTRALFLTQYALIQAKRAYFSVSVKGPGKPPSAKCRDEQGQPRMSG